MHRLWNPFEEERDQGVWSGRYQLQRQRLLQERFEEVLELVLVGFVEFFVRLIVEFLIVGFIEFVFRLIVEFVVFELFVVVRLAPNNEHPSGA